MPNLEILRIFTCFNLRYIKPMIENRYLILFFACNFFLKFCATLIKVKFSGSSVKQKRCGIMRLNDPIFLYFLSIVTLRLKKMRKKTQIIRLFYIAWNCMFFPHFYHIKGDFSWITKSWVGTSKCISASFLLNDFGCILNLKFWLL